MTHDFLIPNVDTDSISFCKQDMSEFTEQERKDLLIELNSYFPELISWEDDGTYDVFVVLKTKNYLKLHDGEIETKGSSIRNPNKEPALRELIAKIVEALLYDKDDEILNIYYEYVKEIHNVRDISRWCTKKTITESVLNPERTNEQKVLDALEGTKVQMGDKVYMYFDVNSELKLQERWENNHNTNKLLGKLYNTIKIFSTVLNIDKFEKFHLKSHVVQCRLADVLGVSHPEKVKRTRKKEVDRV